MTLEQLYRQCRKKLTHETADFDLSQLFHAQFAQYVGRARPEIEVPSDEAFVFQHKIKRLSEGYPLQYLLGEWEFYSIPLAVGEGVLIPRPDTETLVDTALEFMHSHKAPVIADLCAGSGAIALALAEHLPSAQLFAVELSSDALRYLRRNIEARSLGARIKAIEADVREPLPLPTLDLIVSNPPYLTAEELIDLPAQVQYEPLMALDGGEDGLTFYRAIAHNALALLRENGRLILEAGWRQAEDIVKILEQNGFDELQTRRDLGGLERCVIGRRPPVTVPDENG